MASIKFVLRIHQKDATGHSPLYIRIIKDRKTKFVSTGVKLKNTEWDEDKQRVKKNHSNSARMNAALMQKIADAEGHIADTERLRKSTSVIQLKEAIKGKTAHNFFDYVAMRVEKIKPNVSLNTYNSYIGNINKLKTFLGTTDVNFNEITSTVMDDYISYMNNVCKNAKCTQRTNLDIIKLFFRLAIKEKIITADMFDFMGVTVKAEKSKKMFLSKEQLELLTNFKTTNFKDYEIYVDMFFFSVYGGGLRFSDVLSLKWSNFISAENRIRTYIHKTRHEHNFKVGKVALDILEKYKPEKVDQDAFIFDLIKNKEVFEKNTVAHFKIIKHFNRDCTTKLSKIGKMLEFPFVLTFHLSRHTFATNALRNGMRIEYVSKLMDHSNINVTQIYAKIISEELDKAVENFIY